MVTTLTEEVLRKKFLGEWGPHLKGGATPPEVGDWFRDLGFEDTGLGWDRIVSLDKKPIRCGSAFQAPERDENGNRKSYDWRSEPRGSVSYIVDEDVLLRLRGHLGEGYDSFSEYACYREYASRALALFALAVAYGGGDVTDVQTDALHEAMLACALSDPGEVLTWAALANWALDAWGDRDARAVAYRMLATGEAIIAYDPREGIDPGKCWDLFAPMGLIDGSRASTLVDYQNDSGTREAYNQILKRADHRLRWSCSKAEGCLNHLICAVRKY